MPAGLGQLIWLDTADWKAVVPMRTPLDLTGTRLWGQITAGDGGKPAATIDSDDGSIFWTADPVTKLTSALFVKVPKNARDGWRATDRTGQAAQVTVVAHVHRYVTGSPDDEWLGTIYVLVDPASDSELVQAARGTQPILVNKQPDSGILLPALQTGEQGPPGRTASVLNTFPVSLAQDGQTVIPYPVQQPPVIPSTVHLVVNGEEYFPPDIVVGDAAITWACPAFALERSDKLVLRYT